MHVPKDFQEQMEQLLGDASVDFFSALSEPPTTTVRLHPTKGAGLFTDRPSLSWSPNARRLEERPVFALDPLWHAGAYYVQDASSQYLESVLQQIGALESPMQVLDLCAAPGGKSKHILSLVPEGSVVIANEVIRSRAHILQENIWKWGMSHMIITSSDPKIIGDSGVQVDMLVIDAPCSGEGLFRKSPKAMEEWSPEVVDLCAARQKRIIGDAWDVLKPGGFLVYSTCTWNIQENEEVLEWCHNTLGAEAVPLTDHHGEKVDVLRFFPQDHGGEGFSCGVLKKTDEGSSRKSKSNQPRVVSEAAAFAKKHLVADQGYKYTELSSVVSAVPKASWSILGMLLSNGVHVLSAGIPLAEMHGAKNALKPHPMLSHAVDFSSKAYPVIDLKKEEALQYLRRQDVSTTEKNGPAVVCYAERHLGFGRVQNGRILSQYPMYFRLRKDAD